MTDRCDGRYARRVATQAERRAATTEALLDATIRSLSESGYAALTTRGVAERAGVTQGAQQHYFPTKIALVTAAMERLIEQLAANAITSTMHQGTEQERALGFLDRLWELHNLPICMAVLELFTAARTDLILARQVSASTRLGIAAIESVAASLLPTYSQSPQFADFVGVATSTIRGMVSMTSVPGLQDAHPPWPQVRALLMKMLHECATGCSGGRNSETAEQNSAH